MNETARRRFEELKAGGLLPSPRGVALAIMDIARRPDASLREVAHLIQADPAMAGRILRYANVAQGGGLRHIASLGQAVNFLGLFRVRQIVLGFALIEQYQSGDCPAFDYEGYWATSLAIGIAAQHLASVAQSPPDESFTCGLLSGIGRLAFATAFPDQYAEILAQAPSPEALIAAENLHFGIDHLRLSVEMLGSWGLPAVFTEAVGYHEQPAAMPFAPGSRSYALTLALHLAMRIGQLLNLDNADRWEQVPSLYNAAAQVGIEEDDVPPLMEAVATNWHDWATELKLPSRSYSDLRELLAAPPAAFDGKEGAQPLPPLNVGLLVDDPGRRGRLESDLGAMALPHTAITDLAELRQRASDDFPDLIIVDLGASPGEAEKRLRHLRAVAGPGLHIIALIPSAAESGVARLMAAGAMDYIVHEYTQAALFARLTNAQRLISLQSAVRAERELAVNSSGQWALANRRLLRDAMTDVLTQLPNRRYGFDRFAQEWSIASSNASPISCMMLDIDHFKRVNDERGHEVGDIVLRHLANIIESCCRRSDVVFRYGGEEFCCICTGTGLPEAVQLAGRIVSVVRRRLYGKEDDLFPVTLSIGVAERLPAMKEPADLIAAADKALFAAKEAGRDCVRAAAP